MGKKAKKVIKHFAITSTDIGYWCAVNATTLIGAKIVATRRYHGGHVDAVVSIGLWVGEPDHGYYQVQASTYDLRKWITFE